ncbi:MAG: membrane dipeptidase [Oscillospiraceae bacterium]|nr:membrane dipeptidase [Oscillospiraceae bacterium]
MNFPVFDLHCDTALKLIGEDMLSDVSLRRNSAHIDLERAKTLPGYAQCFACFTTPDFREWYQVSPLIAFEREMGAILSQIEKNGDLIRLAYSAKEVRENFAQGMMSGILTIEGPAGFGFDPALLQDLYHVGFRITTLGWNEKNVLTGSHKTGGGLTDLGKEFVREAQSVGMIVDVSHISDEGFWDIINISERPIIASHSNSRAVCGVSRNLTDDMFRAICESGGVAGFNQCAPFVGESPDLDTVCDHILHFLEIDPEGNHIAIGGDLDGCDELPAGFDGVQSYPAMARRLLERGLNEELVRKIYWENALGVMDACCM